MSIANADAERELAPVDHLWYTRCPVPTASSIAIEKGWLEREFAGDGIVIASLRAVSDRAVRESHFDHTQPRSFRQGGNIPPIWARSRGRDVRLIGLTWQKYYQVVISMPESGIATASDLKGRRLAVPRRINDQIDFSRAGTIRGYLAALRSVGMSVDDVELVDLPVADLYIETGSESQRGQLFGARANRRFGTRELLALIRGEVDAIFVSGGRGVDLQALLDANVVFDMGGHPDASVRFNNIAPIALTVSGELLRQRPDLVARYLATLVVAARWAKMHPGEVRRITALEAGVAEEWIDIAHPGIENDLEPVLSPALIAGIDSQKRFLREYGFIGDDFDVDSWIATEPLAEAHRLVAETEFGSEWLEGSDDR